MVSLPQPQLLRDVNCKEAQQQEEGLLRKRGSGSCRQFPRGCRRADVIPDPDEGTSASHLQELNGRHSN